MKKRCTFARKFYFFMIINLRFLVSWASKLLLWGGIFLMAWISFSCDEFCEEPNRTAVVINFYDEEEASLRVKNVTIRGIENDSLLYPNRDIYGGTDLSQVLLPVNPSSNFMSFTIKNDTFPVDTVIIRYSRFNGFISSQCGCVTYADLHSAPESTSNTITHLILTNPNVSTVSYREGVFNAENIRIYY